MRRFNRAFITGGAGYVGSRLVPALLADGYEVVVYDTFWFGDWLPDAVGLAKIRADIRDERFLRTALRGCDAVIHLACLSNDPSSELDTALTRSINLDAFLPLVAAARDAGVRRFINCSTSSVYGISDCPDVREDHPHVPLTLYNTYKSQCERQLAEFDCGDMEWVTVRPATVCGYSPRQRLDLSVNILTNLAVNKGVITVYGGQQMRPNLHIADMVDAYRLLLEAPSAKVAGETFNAGAGNISILELALTVARLVGPHVRLDIQPIQDERSYQVNSDKIFHVLGFRPEHTVDHAVKDLIAAFAAGLLPKPLEDSRFYNVRKMKEIFADLYAHSPPTPADDGILSEIDRIRGAGR